MADAHVAFSCFNCDETFHRRSSGASDARKCCSRKCGFEWQAKVRALTKRVCYRVWRRKPASPAAAPVRRVVERQCVVCGSAFTPPTMGRPKVVCSAACSKQRGKQRAVVTGSRAAYRKARKLRLRGVKVDNVNPIDVLDRDKWTCQLCGAKTPKRLRGTYDDRAPEVDHIVPLAQGGDHSYRNVQCACRRCNLAKSGVAQGQMRLFG